LAAFFPGDAKYDTFNTMEISEVMAHWIPSDGTNADFYWQITLDEPMTALDLFGHDNIVIESDDEVLQSDNWNRFFSYQDGVRRFSINHAEGTNTDVRWGYSFNNEANFDSNDVLGGIGLGGPVSYSAGDYFGCCGTAAGGNGQGSGMASVQIFGRYNHQDDCTEGICENGGVCTDGVGAYTCRCANGYSGDNCAVAGR
jgi:hypothetical protein